MEETGYWVELLIESSIVKEQLLSELLGEIGELTAILVTCIKNAKGRK
ncbi:MAG: hypothetical protein KDA83_06630 [Planctomycetales bacterium]|nr:hypothetical protein [Planctomycetales bacterium]